METNIDVLIAAGLILAAVILRLTVFPKVSVDLSRNFMLTLLCGLAMLNVYIYRSGVDERPPAVLDDDSFRELRRALGTDARVGFISDTLIDDSVESLKRYFQTQYQLAPIVLVEGTSPNLVIGNFRKADPVSVPDDLVLVREFGPGLLLLRKRVQ